MMLPLAVTAAEKSADLAAFQKACLGAKKKAGLCRCLSSNVERKIASQEITADQLPLAIQAVKNEVPDAESNTTSYDHVADLLAGLEPHCLKNANYSP